MAAPAKTGTRECINLRKQVLRTGANWVTLVACLARAALTLRTSRCNTPANCSRNFAHFVLYYRGDGFNK